MNNEKLILKVRKSYPTATTALWVPACIAERVKDLAEKTNKDYKSVACELLEFALDRVEIVE